VLGCRACFSARLKYKSSTSVDDCGGPFSRLSGSAENRPPVDVTAKCVRRTACACAGRRNSDLERTTADAIVLAMTSSVYCSRLARATQVRQRLLSGKLWRTTLGSKPTACDQPANPHTESKEKPAANGAQLLARLQCPEAQPLATCRHPKHPNFSPPQSPLLLRFRTGEEALLHSFERPWKRTVLPTSCGCQEVNTTYCYFTIFRRNQEGQLGS
jgi:hypothetical protein